MSRIPQRLPSMIRTILASLATMALGTAATAAVAPPSDSLPIDRVTEIRRALLEQDHASTAVGTPVLAAQTPKPWANWSNWNNWKNWRNA